MGLAVKSVLRNRRHYKGLDGAMGMSVKLFALVKNTLLGWHIHIGSDSVGRS